MIQCELLMEIKSCAAKCETRPPHSFKWVANRMGSGKKKTGLCPQRMNPTDFNVSITFFFFHLFLICSYISTTAVAMKFATDI